ncbi:MAG: hypothetical protein K8S99_18030 [Planctomycetes bacterium]|nr:hypothetical protein [Planctomycetota bacterium]
MFDRKVILRVLLWSLCIAAVVGAIGILTSSGDVVWRVMTTGIITAVACALMMPLAVMIDRAKTRVAGLMGMCVVVAEFLLVMAMTWLPRGYFGHYFFEEVLGGTALTIGVAGPLATGFIRAAATPVGRTAGRVGAAITGVVAVAIIVMLWGGLFHRVLGERYLLSALSLAGLGFPAVGSLVGIGTGPTRRWRWVGVAAAVAAYAVALVGIWGEPQNGGTVLVATIGLAVLVAHANVLMLCQLTPGQRWVRVASIGAAIATSLLVDLCVAYEIDSYDESPFLRAAAALGIIASCGTLAVVVLNRLNRGVTLERGTPGEFHDIALTCPRCNRKQTLPLGEALCADCGLRISVQVEEPRCVKCGYLLYKLTGDACPECGTAIAAAPATA